MSTPAGKQFDPIDLSAYASQRVRERAATQQHPSESDASSIASPYAPKRARGPAGAGPRAVEGTGDPDSPAQTAETGRARPAEESIAAASDSTHPLPSFLVSNGSRAESEQARPAESVESPPVAAEASETDAADAADADWLNLLAEARIDDDAALRLQPGDAAVGPDDHEPSAKDAEQSDSDRDLERLEASLHWLQRAGSTARLPRAASLAPVPGFPPADGTRRRYSAELIAKGGRPRSLEPERMAPPPVNARGDKLRLAVYILVPSIVVGAVSYYLVSGGWAPQPPAAPPQAVAYEPTITPQAPPAVVGQEHALVSAPNGHGDVQASPPNEKSLGPAEISPPEKSAELPAEKSAQLPAEKSSRLPAEKSAELSAEKPLERHAMAVPQPAETAPPPPPAPAPAPSTPDRKLDPEEIKILLKRGDHFIASGDLVTARMVFQRAAEAGDATAAIALGATYDPGVLARLGVVGMGAADVEKARHWYQKAESLGSPEASRRLQLLAAR